MEQKKPARAAKRNDEIDLLELFFAMKRRLWLILLAGFLGTAAAGAFSKFVLIPQFQSTAQVYVLSKETTLTSLADLQIGTQLTQDYKIIIDSRPVLEEVIENLGLNLTYRQLREKVSIGNPQNTRILSITAQDSDPNMAKLIADQVAETASSYIGDIMEMVPPKIIESGEVPTQKSSPSNTKNAMMGGLLGVMIVCGFVTLEFLLNDTITTEEDVAKYLELSVLASVPERREGAGGNSSESGKSKNKAKRRRLK